MIRKELDPDTNKLATQIVKLKRTVKAAQDVTREQRKIIAKARVQVEAKKRLAGWVVDGAEDIEA